MNSLYRRNLILHIHLSEVFIKFVFERTTATAGTSSIQTGPYHRLTTGQVRQQASFIFVIDTLIVWGVAAGNSEIFH